MRLGIDFGTTRTVVAAAVSGRYPVAVFETAHGFSEFVPGLAVRDGARLELGFEAQDGLAGRADTIVRSIKREVGARPPDDRLGEIGLDRTALELATDYLARLKRLLYEQSNLDLETDEPLEAMVEAVTALCACDEASAIAYLQVNLGEGKTRWGAGVDTNIELASVRAVLSALNRT